MLMVRRFTPLRDDPLRVRFRQAGPAFCVRGLWRRNGRECTLWYIVSAEGDLEARESLGRHKPDSRLLGRCDKGRQVRL